MTCAPARDPAHAERDREVKEAAGIGLDRNVLARVRRAGLGGHRTVHHRLRFELYLVLARRIATAAGERGEAVVPVSRLDSDQAVLPRACTGACTMNRPLLTMHD